METITIPKKQREFVKKNGVFVPGAGEYASDAMNRLAPKLTEDFMFFINYLIAKPDRMNSSHGKNAPKKGSREYIDALAKKFYNDQTLKRLDVTRLI